MPNPEDDLSDSLDRVQQLMAIEELLTEQINSDQSLTPEKRSRLIRELELWSDKFWDQDDPDDDSALSIYVRKLGPRGPWSRSGSIALPPEDIP